MPLPNAQAAIIEPEKVRDYVLSNTHPISRNSSSASFAAMRNLAELMPALVRSTVRNMLSVEKCGARRDRMRKWFPCGYS
jgi:hypothetical protein